MKTRQLFFSLITFLSGFESNSHLINVYGKVIDQYGQPVAGADVNGGTLLVVSPIASAAQNFQRRQIHRGFSASRDYMEQALG
jgi:hypothetical protein